METPDWLRTTVQVLVGAVLGYAPVAGVLSWIGLDLTPAQVAIFLVPIVTTVYWNVLRAAETSDVVAANPFLRKLVAIAMGGYAVDYTADAPE